LGFAFTKPNSANVRTDFAHRPVVRSQRLGYANQQGSGGTIISPALQTAPKALLSGVAQASMVRCFR
jgi:hypothetical protein